MDRAAIAPAIRETVALGFIEITEQGFAGIGDHRQPNVFRITYRPTDREASTDEWRRIMTVEDATVTLNNEVFADIGMSDGQSRALADSIETLRRNSGDF